MVEQRRELGDRLDVPREVEHFAYFSRKGRAESVAAELESRGYRTELVRAGFRTALVARTTADVTPETTRRIMTEVFENVENGGGEYDGWGGPISPADPA